jgi:CHRD domain
MQSILRASLKILAMSGTLALITPAFAETVALKANLSAANEVPAVSSKAVGSLTATYDPSTKTLTYTINYSDLSGDPMAAHFHGPAASGENAGVAVPISAPMSNPIKGTATLSDAQANELMAGKWYVNIHTSANKGGELRGQVEKGM